MRLAFAAWIAAALAAGALAQKATEEAALPVPSPAIWFGIAKTGRIAAALCDDGKARIWSLPDKRLLHTLDAASNDYSVNLLSDDGTWLLIADHGGAVRIWNLANGALHAQRKLWPYAVAGAFAPDGKSVALARANQPAEVFDTASGRKLYELQRTVGGAAALVFSRDGAHIAAADADTVVRVYSARNGELLARNADFLMEPLAAAFTPDGKHLAAAGGDKVVAFLDSSTGRPAQKSGRLPDAVAYLEFSPDGASLAVVLMNSPDMSKAAPLLILDNSGRQVAEWLPPSVALGGAWTADGRLMIGTASGGVLHVWRVR